MHKLASILLLAALASAQSPLTTLSGGTNYGNVGNNIFFDLQINQTVTISRIDFLCGAGTTASAAGVMEVWIGPTTYVGNTVNAGLWTMVATTGPVTVGPSATTVGNLQVPLCLGPGNYGVALKATAFTHGYTNGDGNATPGSGTNQTFTRTEMVLRAGANQNTPWTSGLNTPRIFNGAIYYTQGGTPVAVAAWERYGQGCYRWYHSFYETYLNPSTSFDLKSLNAPAATNGLRLNFTGTGYLVGPFQNGTGTFFTHTASATTLSLTTNNTTVTLATPFPLLYPSPAGPQITQSLEICDNGFISPAGTNGTNAVPSVALFLNGTGTQPANPRWAPAWFDFDPSLGGQIKFEVDPSNQAFYITWVNVPDVGLATTLNNFQVMFTTSGDVEYRYGAMSLAIGGVNPCLTGWTPGGSVLDPGITDITAITTPFLTGPTDNPPLALGLRARPQLGTTAIFDCTDIPPSTAIGLLFLSFGQISPGTPLAAIGMPDCFQLVNLNIAAVNLPIPNNTVFNGVRIFSQGVTLTSGYNALGALSSNGVRMTVGSL
jgi:hypothetical protein